MRSAYTVVIPGYPDAAFSPPKPQPKLDQGFLNLVDRVNMLFSKGDEGGSGPWMCSEGIGTEVGYRGPRGGVFTNKTFAVKTEVFDVPHS